MPATGLEATVIWGHQARNLFTWGLGLLTAVAVVAIPSPSDAALDQRCFGRAPTIVGNKGNNQIVGTNGRDVIISGAGRDWIHSLKGKDFVCAGPGYDKIRAAEGVNYMKGGAGNDSLDGRLGKGNVAIGGRGIDSIEAEGRIEGGPGNDEIYSYGYLNPSQSPFVDMTDAGGGEDFVSGGSSNELLNGGPKGDRIYAGSGNDRLRGKGGNDDLYGEGGNDDINGGAGADRCYQGPGTGPVVCDEVFGLRE